MPKELTSLRQWAVEQAVMLAGPETGQNGTAERVTGLAAGLLAYVSKPTREANLALLDAARNFDGKQDAGALIGLLADALEQATGRGE